MAICENGRMGAMGEGSGDPDQNYVLFVREEKGKGSLKEDFKQRLARAAAQGLFPRAANGREIEKYL